MTKIKIKKQANLDNNFIMNNTNKRIGERIKDNVFNFKDRIKKRIPSFLSKFPKAKDSNLTLQKIIVRETKENKNKYEDDEISQNELIKKACEIVSQLN